jgi:hypothetical protein
MKTRVLEKIKINKVVMLFNQMVTECVYGVSINPLKYILCFIRT